MNYNIGDVVRLTSVTEDDKLMGRYVGEEGIYQGTWIPEEEDLSLLMGENENYVIIKFNGHDNYVVNKNQLDGVRGANIETILAAYNLEDNKELLDTLDEYTSRLIEAFC
jgi:hypothetical protein